MSSDSGTAIRITPTEGLVPGIVGGLVGGMVFGMMMQMMDMMPTIAMLVGSESVAVGWIVHLAVSAVLGAGYGLVGSRLLGSWGTGIVAGVAYGLVWWVLGGLIAMPARLGAPLFNLDSMAWKSLMGHVAFGAVLGAVAVALARRKA
jgi:uncharacterized membrane protein YagU involved in acid resistance